MEPLVDDHRIETLEKRLDKQEDRLVKIEVAQGEHKSDLHSMDDKLDQLLVRTEHIQTNFVSSPTCLAKMEGTKEDVNGLGKKVRNSITAFNDHIHAHLSKADRYVTWITGILLLTFVIGKMAKAW